MHEIFLQKSVDIGISYLYIDVIVDTCANIVWLHS